jgi:hypothetical protein
MTSEEIERRLYLAKILRLQELRDQAEAVDALTPAEREARVKANLVAHLAAEAEIEAAK